MPVVLALSEVPNERKSAYLQRSHPLKNDAFTYFPFTDGRRFISPAIVFGTADIKDSEIEQEVVDGLGATASS